MEGSLKKTTIVHVLRVLHNYTSYDYPATQTAIVNYLNDLDIACTRKTVGRNIRYLIESGVPIKRRMQKNGGYYYDHKNDRFFAKIKRTEEKK